MPTIVSLHIENFRSIKNCSIHFKDVTPIVGYNNAGKSNILKALQWFVCPEKLSQDYFNDSGKHISIAGRLSGIDAEILGRLDEGHRRRIEPYCQDGNLQLKRILENPNDPATRIKLLVRNPAIESDEASEAWDTNPTGIANAIKALLPEPIEVRAMSDAAEDVAKAKNTTTIGKLLNEIINPVLSSQGPEVETILNSLTERFSASGRERAEELKNFDEDASEILSDIFPDIKVSLHVPTPTLESLFKAGTLKVLEADRGVQRDVSALGHGAQRAIQIALIRYLADKASSGTDRVSKKLLLVEEPELYLHPSAIEATRAAFRKLAAKGYQVVYCTHSAQMVPSKDIPQAVLVRKGREGTFARKTLRDAAMEAIEDAPSQSHALFSLTNSSQILFADQIVLVEGRTEEMLMPRLYECFFGHLPEADKISFIGQGGCGGTKNSCAILKALDIPHKVLVDLDFAFRDGIRQSYMKRDNPLLEAARAKFRLMEEANEFEPNNQFKLAEDGFPTKGGNIKPTQAFSIFAATEEGKTIISELHVLFREENIWFWPKGSIERHLGLKKKDERTWTKFSEDLEGSALEEMIPEYEDVKAFLDWIHVG